MQFIQVGGIVVLTSKTWHAENPIISEWIPGYCSRTYYMHEWFVERSQINVFLKKRDCSFQAKINFFVVQVVNSKVFLSVCLYVYLKVNHIFDILAAGSTRACIKDLKEVWNWWGVEGSRFSGRIAEEELKPCAVVGLNMAKVGFLAFAY